MNHTVFLYLNRYWVKRERDERKIRIFLVHKLALVQWEAKVFVPINREDRLLKALLLAIEREQNGQVADEVLVKNFIGSFLRLGVNYANLDEECLDIYKNDFEAPFLIATEMYYRGEAATFMVAARNSNFNYLKKVQDRLREEEDRVKRYGLLPTTSTNIISMLKDTFYPPYFHAIWTSVQEVSEFAGVENLPASLSHTHEGQDLLRKNFEQHVEKAGLNAVASLVDKDSEPDPKTYLDTLLEVHTKYSVIITQHLYGDADFADSLCDVCTVFVNRNAVMGPTGSKSPEVLVKYADRLLRKDKSLEEVDIDGALDRLMVIFNYLEDKDIFLHFYAARMSKRLIYGDTLGERSHV
ncbi:Cullin [Armillaria nabsnona]|nr:Cullin [Armillaria nabsnona]